MFSVALVVIALIGIALVILGVGVFLRNTKNLLNRLFFTFAIWVALWMIINFVAAETDAPHGVSLWANRLVLIAGGATLISLTGFILQLTAWMNRAGWFKYLVGVSFASWVLCLSPLVVQNVSVENGQVANLFGWGAALYFIPLFLTAVTTAVILIAAHYRLKGLLRVQVDTISISILIVVPIVIVGNAVLPLQGNYSLVSYTPLSLALIVTMMAYVIIRHRLFNVRWIIVRSVAYVFSLGLLSIIYALGTHVVSQFIDNLHNSLSTAGANVLLVLAIITLYQPIKRTFDKWTNSIFYRDAYDPQELFGQLNRMLVTSLDVKYLMMQSISILETYLKPEFAMVSLNASDGSQRLFTSKKLPITEEDLERIRSLASRVRHKVVNVDYMEGPREAELRELLQRNDISALIRLTQNVRSGDNGFGYMVLGIKKSSNSYTPQDTRVLDTVANELIIAIQNALHYEEIQQFNLVLQDRVDEATRKLRRTNEKLKALDETKDDFISMASHQLRTPLTSIKGYLSMVLEGDAGKINETQRKMLGQSFVSSQRMVYLIADLLNVSRLKTGKFVIEPTTTNLAHMVSEEIDQLVETAAARDIELTYVQPKHFPDLQLDETKTRQVVMNFVDNAIYYTPAGGHIKVVLEDNPTSVELKVVDDGIGVPKHEQHHLFTKFYRAGNAQKARPDGTGLGLFMAKKVILAQGGSIIFESKEGKGSTFGFLFPKNHKSGAKPAAPLTVAEEPVATK